MEGLILECFFSFSIFLTRHSYTICQSFLFLPLNSMHLSSFLIRQSLTATYSSEVSNPEGAIVVLGYGLWKATVNVS